MVRQKNFSKPRGLLYVWEGRVLPIATPPMIGEVGTLPQSFIIKKQKTHDNRTIVIRRATQR